MVDGRHQLRRLRTDSPVLGPERTAGTSAKLGIVDRGDIKIDEAAMRKYGIAPYLDAIKAGLGSIMVSDATWNGQSLTGSKRMITEILKTELGFKGFVTTDWNAADTAGGVVAAVNAGVDMLMQPADWKGDNRQDQHECRRRPRQ